MVPGAVVANIFVKESLDVGELVVPKREVPDEPLPVGPDMVIFAIFVEHLAEEGEFIGRKGGDMG